MYVYASECKYPQTWKAPTSLELKLQVFVSYQDERVLGLNSDLCQERYMLLTAGPSLKFSVPSLEKQNKNVDLGTELRLSGRHTSTLLAGPPCWPSVSNGTYAALYISGDLMF